MKQKRFFTRSFSGTLPLFFAAGLVLFQPVYGSAAAKEPTDSFEDHVLTRIDRAADGIVRSHMVDSHGNIYTDNSVREHASPTGKSRLKGAVENLPAAYDLRTQNLTTSIKDQGVTGCCWAFSAVKAIESNCIKRGLLTAANADFSENHLAWFSYNPSDDPDDPLYGDGISVYNSIGSFKTFPYDNGGSSILATFTLAKWSGLELESLAPFNASSNSFLKSMANTMSKNNNMRYDSYAHMQNAISFDEYMVGNNYYYKNPGLISEMKQSILDNGAMSVAFYFAKKHTATSANGTSYYQTDYSGSSAVKAANHCVTIIGWDDNYSRKNFSTPPSKDGAWLIANSYGTEFGDQGYFWLSYYDQSISDCYTFQTEPIDNYDNIYQYDGFGWGNANVSDSYNIKAANIFTADSRSPQQLSAVSFYTLTDDQEYKIQVYRGVSSSPTNGVLVSECTTSGVMEHNGYHTVSLAAPVNLEAGEKFSVVVTYIQSGSSPIYVPFEGNNIWDSTLIMKYDSKKGQSFLYTKLKNRAGRKWIDMSVLGYNNVCIKAFSRNTDTASPLPSVVKKITLGKRETFQLEGSVQTYFSNDPSLVTVSDSGKITAKSVGTTTITMSDGTSSSLVRVTVKKAPSSVRLKPSGRKKIRKGKSFRLKVKLPSGSASRKITFRSSKKRVASVTPAGRVTAHRPGRAIIKVRTYNGKTARIKVTVK